MEKKSDDDCYFYYYSTCTKGDDCPYRHCELALGSEITCTHWQNGKCLRSSVCKYRHMESRINRSSIQCWFETQPTGCRKPHCVFLHKKPRTLALDEDQTNSEGIILPVVTAANTPADSNENNSTLSLNANNNCINNNSNINNNNSNCPKSGLKLFDDSDYLNQSLSTFNDSTTNHNINIEPISISLNDCDEESDNESERNGDKNDDKSQNEFNQLNENIYNKSKNYGIKTLEQIRMEKVFNTETDESMSDENNHFIDNYLKNDSMIKTQKHDLRVKIRRQKPTDNDSSMASVSNLSSNSPNNWSDSVPDFGIKTLDQIRREREELAKNSDSKSGLKENQEPKGQKRSASDPNTTVVKIRRTGPTAITSLKVQQKSETKEKCIENIDNNLKQTVNTSESESNDESNIVTSTDTNHKHRIKSIDTDLDEFDFLDGESTNNLDSNDAIDDEDDELMREINQVINS